MREREDDMEVSGGEQLLGTGEEPPDLVQVLALGAVPVTARVEGEALIPTSVFTGLQVASECWGSALDDIPDHLALFRGGGMVFNVGLPVTT
jgi:hypothetical protein